MSTTTTATMMTTALTATVMEPRTSVQMNVPHPALAISNPLPLAPATAERNNMKSGLWSGFTHRAYNIYLYCLYFRIAHISHTLCTFKYYINHSYKYNIFYNLHAYGLVAFFLLSNGNVIWCIVVTKRSALRSVGVKFLTWKRFGCRESAHLNRSNKTNEMTRE